MLTNVSWVKMAVRFFATIPSVDTSAPVGKVTSLPMTTRLAQVSNLNCNISVVTSD